MRMHEGEGRIVADGADVTEMIGQPLQLCHQCPQIPRAGRRFDAERRLDRVRKRDAIGNSAVARGARGKPCGFLDRRPGHQRLDPLVHVAEPLFEPHHRLAAGGEAEMSRLDDSGMHRTDRDLMQALALDRKELV